MRLADRLIDLADSGKHPLAADWKVWAGKIRRARRYVVCPSAGQLSFGTTEAAPIKAAAKTRPATRFPDEICWFEWTGPSASMGPRAGNAARPGSAVPLRSGVLIETRDPEQRVGTMSWVYEMPGGSLEPTPLSVTFDWRAAPQPVPDLRKLAYAVAGRSWKDDLAEMHRGGGFGGASLDDTLAEEDRWGQIPCVNLDVFWSYLVVAGERDPATAQSIVENALADLMGEPKFVLGLVICLCAANLLDVTGPDDMDRLNAVRRKRGRSPLLPFHTLKASDHNVIHLSDRGRALETTHGFHAA